MIIVLNYNRFNLKWSREERSMLMEFDIHLTPSLGLGIRPCHTAAILSCETKKALFYHAKPHPHGFDCEA